MLPFTTLVDLLQLLLVSTLILDLCICKTCTNTTSLFPLVPESMHALLGNLLAFRGEKSIAHNQAKLLVNTN